MAALENNDRLLWVDSASVRPLLVALPYGQCRACGTWLGKWSLPAARRSLNHKTYVKLLWRKPPLAAAPVVVLHIPNKSTFLRGKGVAQPANPGRYSSRNARASRLVPIR